MDRGRRSASDLILWPPIIWPTPIYGRVDPSQRLASKAQAATLLPIADLTRGTHMAWDTGISGRALKIAACTESPLRVMAGPGTGKSFAMQRRVARLLEEGVAATRVLAVTFTRNAARSMLDDLHSLGIDGCEDIDCGTLHSFCFRLLRRDDVFAFLGRVPRPLLTFTKAACLRFEAAPMVEDICSVGDFGGRRDCAKRILAFEAAWARLQSDKAGWPEDPVDKAFHAELVQWLAFHEGMLIGELIPEALRYIRGNPACAAVDAYDHVIVDEYQDLNKAEQELLDLLSANGNQAVVGDVDQSIYSFRHANPQGIEEFNTHRPGTHDESLDECRRCPKLVVRLADHLIKHNHPPGIPPRLKPRSGNPTGVVHVIQWPSLGDEVEGITGFVQSLINGGTAPGDILILSPRRLIGCGIRDAIKEEGINVHSFYNEDVLDDDGVQEALTILNLAAQPEDRVSLRWWLGAGSPSWCADQYATLRKCCEDSGLSPFKALDQLVAGTLIVPGTGTLVSRYKMLKERLAGLKALSLEAVIDSLFPDGEDWAAPIREMAVSLLPDADDIADLRERLTGAITQPDIPESEDFVRVMSLHKSKGLTSKVVIVAGCVEGIIPFVDYKETPARQRELLREQRRLFYAAITRCTERLVLSSVSKFERKLAHKIRAKISSIGHTLSSRFLGELGPDLPTASRGKDWVADGYL